VFLTSPKKLRLLGMLGMNQRNCAVIAPLNPRHLYPAVDNKLKTKLLAEQAGISVPKLLGTVQYQHDVKGLEKMLANHRQFVIKPAKGSGGKGILVITERDHQLFFKPSGDVVNHSDVERHVSNILSGLYSLGGAPDVAMIEALVKFDPVFENYSHEGVPDIRVVVYKGYPLMAMLRLATHASDGKTNLHQGAVGVGIDLGTGKALRAVQYDRPISHHPDTRKRLDAIAIPHWDRLLPLAAACYDVTALGYLGVDIVLDRELGPLIIELNARPGLAIQIANHAGLVPRIKVIDNLTDAHINPQQRALFSKYQFSPELSETEES
jgi:alpha-L-glutamate ligase-like protein